MNPPWLYWLPLAAASLHLVYLPLAPFGYLRFLGAGAITPARATLAFILGASYQVWANLLHRWRAKPRR